MDSLSGKTIRWSVVDGPMAGTTFDHTFHEDGSVTWKIIDGEHKGASRSEKAYGSVRVADNVLAISYLAASGHTLTVILNLADQQMFGFASGQNEWHSAKGTFRFLE